MTITSNSDMKKLFFLVRVYGAAHSLLFFVDHIHFMVMVTIDVILDELRVIFTAIDDVMNLFIDLFTLIVLLSLRRREFVDFNCIIILVINGILTLPQYHTTLVDLHHTLARLIHIDRALLEIRSVTDEY